MLQARGTSVDANEGTKILFFHQPYHKRRKAVFAAFSENQNSLLNRHKATAVSCRPEVCVNWACNSSFPLSALLFAFLSPLLVIFFLFYERCGHYACTSPCFVWSTVTLRFLCHVTALERAQYHCVQRHVYYVAMDAIKETKEVIVS